MITIYAKEKGDDYVVPDGAQCFAATLRANHLLCCAHSAFSCSSAGRAINMPPALISSIVAM